MNGDLNIDIDWFKADVAWCVASSATRTSVVVIDQS